MPFILCTKNIQRVSIQQCHNVRETKNIIGDNIKNQHMDTE